ncbi:MAG: PmoA family protein [Verrucomicrobiales bacterium]
MKPLSLRFLCQTLISSASLTSWATADGPLQVVENETTIVLTHEGSPFLTYHKAEVSPPEGVDPIFKRSGFIHPLKTPGGATVTGIHPADHYHHLGLWHAWVKCEHNGEPVDFWNLKTGTGRIAYVKTVSTESDEHSAGFIVEQAHIAYKGESKKPMTILSEQLHVTARIVDGAFEIDYDTAQKNITEHSLELPAYRYGGPIAYRAPHHWKNGNSDYLSSEGKTRIDGHTTRSRWVAMFGPAEEGKDDGPVASLTILSNDKNHDAPQRMRVWPPESSNGAIFFNYVPIQETGWEIKPGETSTMRYRLVVQDAKPDAAAINARWDSYVGKE